MSWLDSYFTKALTAIQVAGVTLPARGSMNFVSGVTAADNPSANRTDLTIGGTISNPILTGTVTNNGTITILGGDTKSKPQTTTGNIATSTAAASTTNLYAVAVGEVYVVDALVVTNRASPSTGNIAGWKLTGLFFGGAGPAATLSGTIVSQAFGGGTGVFATAPNLITSGANIQLQVTSPDTTARTWSWEAHILRALL